MESVLVLLIIFIGILVATGLFRPVLDSIVGGIVKVATFIVVVAVIGVYLYGKIFG